MKPPEQRERHGFLGFAVEVHVAEVAHRSRGERPAQRIEKHWMSSTAAGDEQLVDRRGDVALEGEGDGSRGEVNGGAHDVRGRLIDHRVIEPLQSDTNLSSHISSLSTKDVG